MPKIEYKSIKFQQKSLELINIVNQVVEEYQAQGYELTLRQAYYQLVARGYIPNNERSYKNIGNLINDGRLAGLIDWHSITDRTRNLRSNSHWDNPADVYVKRVALTMNQIGTYNPPPNQAKITDSRASKYIDEYGNESWELDALEPQVITDLITNEVTALRNDEIYRSVCDSEERGKDELRMIERNYDKAVAFLESEE